MSHGVQARAEYRNRIERDSVQKVTRFYKYVRKMGGVMMTERNMIIKIEQKTSQFKALPTQIMKNHNGRYQT
jgi:hypothetical protein